MKIVEQVPSMDLKKITSIATVFSLVVVLYYAISTYKTILEIKQIKKDNI